MNAGAYGMQIGSYVREVKLYRRPDEDRSFSAATKFLSEIPGHTSFAPDDMMLAVILELPSKPFNVILEGIRICNEKRRRAAARPRRAPAASSKTLLAPPRAA